MKQVVFLLLVGAAVAPIAVSQEPGPVNAACAAAHCALQSAACFTDSMCQKNIGCVSKCFEDWDKDKTPEKFTVQNCTGICTFSYTSKAYINFMSCIADHKCMNLPSIPNTCKGPNNITILKKVPISELKGPWRVVRGYHPVYDCYPCQKDSLSPYNSTAWIYNPNYQVYLANGSLGLINQSGYLRDTTSEEEGYSIYFVDAGVGNFEKWWIIDKADDNSYFLVYYCGNVFQWNFEGAIVLSRTKLPTDAYPVIAESYKKAIGLDFAKFCTPVTDNCPN